MVKSYQTAGNRPLRTGHRLDQTREGAGHTDAHPMPEDRLRDLLETLELRGAACEHDPGPGYAVQTLTHQHFVNTYEEISRSFVEDLGGKGGRVNLVPVATERGDLDRRILESLTVEGGADSPLAAFRSCSRGLQHGREIGGEVTATDGNGATQSHHTSANRTQSVVAYPMSRSRQPSSFSS